jgi:hypothetical protein
MRNQSTWAGLGLAQRFEEARDQQDVRDAIIAMAKHLRSRASVGKPHVTPLNEAGGQRQTPGWSLILVARACLDAARERGGDAPRLTATEVALYFDTLKTIALRGYSCAETSAECAIVDFAREAGDAQSAVTRYATERTMSAAMDARREVLELIPAAERVARIDRQLSSHPQSMGVVR